jgi:release factor glutamine methyltransferase
MIGPADRPGTIQSLLNEGVSRLREAGSETPRLDAELLLGHAVGVDRTGLAAHPEAAVGPAAAATYEAGITRRAAGEPVAYIRGLKEFFGLAFSVDRRALIPRPETELLVELGLAELARRLTERPRPIGTPPVRVADVGTGSGAVAVSIAVTLRRRGSLDEVDCLLTDASPDALQLARENAVAHGTADRLRFEVADLLPAGEERFDIVLANLPYIPSTAIPGLPVAASFEPREALDGGPDGLAVIARLLERLPGVLAPGGTCLLEIGSDQVAAMIECAGRLIPGWALRIEHDLSGGPRVVRIDPPGPDARA